MNVLTVVALIGLVAAPKPAGKTQLKLDVKPESAVIYVDGKRRGTGAKELVLNVDPGRHSLKVVHRGDEHVEVVSVKKGEIKRWSWAFEDDRMDRKKKAEGAGAADEDGDTSPDETP